MVDCPPCFCQHEITTCLGKKVGFECLFERPNLPADGWLSQMELLTGFRHAPFFGHDPEVHQVVVIQPLHQSSTSSIRVFHRIAVSHRGNESISKNRQIPEFEDNRPTPRNIEKTDGSPSNNLFVPNLATEYKCSRGDAVDGVNELLTGNGELDDCCQFIDEERWRCC